MREFEQTPTPNNEVGQTNKDRANKQPANKALIAIAIIVGIVLLGVGMLAGSIIVGDNDSLASAVQALFTNSTDDNTATTTATSTSSTSESDENDDSDTASSSVENNLTPGTGVTGTQTITRTVPSYPTSNPNGTPDLVLLDVMVGVYNDKTDEFEEMDVIDLDGVKGSEEVAVRFTIENQGDKTVDEWEFEADLPTKPRETFSYNSADEDDLPLLPTAGRTYTLTFDRVREGIEEVTISVDPDDEVEESNENNNDITLEFETLD